MSGLRPITIGIIGTGPIAHDLVCDVLNDQFAFGQPDQEGYFADSELYSIRALLPVGKDLTTDGIFNVWQWAMRCDLNFRSITDGTDNEVTGGLHDTQESETTTDDVVAEMIDQLTGAENPMLLVLADNGVMDDRAEAAAAAALTANIPVYDLARALRTVEWRDCPNFEEPPQIEEEGTGQLALVVDHGPDVTLSGADVALIQDALTVADAYLQQVRAQLTEGSGQVTQALVAARAVLAPAPEQPDKPSTKQYMEVFNPESARWERAGRGRPKKDALTRMVPKP